MELSTAEGEAHHLLSESLPMYVVKCFTAAGFDTIDVISKMDVSTKPGNSIEQIEQYISTEYPDYFASKSKKFPPGHRLRIQQFVDSVKKRVSLGKQPHSGQRSDGRKKRGLTAVRIHPTLIKGSALRTSDSKFANGYEFRQMTMLKRYKRVNIMKCQ